MIFEIYFDGSCGPKNPGGTAAFGYTILLDGETIKYESGIIGSGEGMTNNVAEHAALNRAFEAFVDYVNKHSLSRIELKVNGDSQLVIKQMNGEYNIRKDKAYFYWADRNRHFRDRIRKSGISLSFQWIPREQNTFCDELSKEHENKFKNN